MLSYTDEGSGEPTVLLHGIPGSRRTWAGVVPLLARRRVLVPDLLGFGRSPDALPATHAVEQARAVLAMMDEARVESAHLAGFDFGGPVAVAVHRLARERVSALTLIATNLLTDTPVPLPLRSARVPVVGELLFRLLFSPPGLATLWMAATVDRKAFPLHTFREALDRRGNATARRIFIESLRDLHALYSPIEAELERVEVPVTVVWGDRDPFFPVAVGQRTAGRFRSSRWIVVEQCGHFLPQERPEAVARAILSSSPSGRG